MNNNQKHAYLIMAHKQFDIVTKTISMLDDERNDFYIHIDKKAGKINTESFLSAARHSKVYFTKRINTFWGASSLVDCEMILLSECLKNGKYNFIHLLSGADMPIKTKKQIFDFFDCHQNTQFLQIGNSLPHMNRLRHYHFLLNSPNVQPRISIYVKRTVDYLNNHLKIDRLKKYGDIKIVKTAQWFSITGKCAEYVLSQRRFIHKLTRFTSCADEMFLGTVLYKSPFWDQVYNPNQSWDGHMRYIDRIRNVGPSPHTFTIDDKELIDASNMLFARKFDETVDSQIIEYVYSKYSDRNLQEEDI